MKRKNKTKEEMIEMIKKVEGLREKGESYAEASKKAGFSSAAYFYQVKKRLADHPEDVRKIVTVPQNGNSSELKILRIENQRLKNIVADQALDIQTLKEYAGRR